MSWHHIIPYPLLRDVWNLLVDQHIATELAEARVAIRQYLLLSDRKHPNVDTLVERMRAENTDQKRAAHYHLQSLDVAEAHQLATAAVWPAWNTVEGPQRERRSDDPGDHFLDRFTYGLTAEEAARMRAIEALFGEFQAFIKTGPAPAPDDLRALARVASRTRPIVCCDLPIRYRPEMWVEDGTGLWRKRRNQERYTVAGK